jgi:hypothetical protein
MTIDVKVFGTKEVERMINYAPVAATEYMRRWLFHESRTFVGNKKKDGSFRRELKNKTNIHGKKWRPFVAKRFKGYVENKNTLNMALHMGPNLSGNKKLRELMETGYTILPTNAKWLIIPNYKNLAKIGIKSKFMLKFNEMNKKSLFDIVKNENNGSISYFLDPDGNNDTKNFRHDFGGQLFFGVRRTRIKKQFSFISSWNARVPTVLKRGERYLKSAMSRTQKQDAAQWQIPG